MGEQPKIGDGAGPRTLAKAVPGRDTPAADRVRAAEFPTALRGYEREAVDGFVAEVADLIDTLESRQARETVVQRALEEVGEETSAILKQAHESADDITARSRSQAEDRVEVARQEAVAILYEAKQEAIELQRETDDLREERTNLIEELRRIVTETLAVADAAADRLEPSSPEGVVEAPIDEPIDPPYDGAGDVDPPGEWPAEESSEPTRELSVPQPEDTPARPSG